MSDLRRNEPPQALSDSGKSSILTPTEMMQSHPIRSSTEEPSGGGSGDPTVQSGQTEIVEPSASRPPARVTFGEELRRERELRQVGLREIAEATKINRRYLEALERNDFTDLPGGLFNRSFVRAYCKTIGIDDEAMVNAYLLEEQVQSAKGDQFDPDVWRGDPSSRGKARPSVGARTGRSPGTVWLWVLVVVILVVSAATLVYLRYGSPEDATPDSVLATPTHGEEPNR
jgi:transcriptional regulator with XRE-family HTH domain